MPVRVGGGEMAAFFVRRLVGGAVDMLIVGFLLYTLLVPPFISRLQHLDCSDCLSPQLPAIQVKSLTVMYVFDKSWPINYLTWLFDPRGTTVQTFTFAGKATIGGGYAPSQTITFVHSSLLSGDFGYSLFVAPGTPVLSVLGLDGPSLLLLLSVPFGTLLFFMLVVSLQRRGRPVVRELAVPDNPVRMVWRRAELWPLR
jgi:ABC-type dipeptide/oligopeptide/nickel transport system permease component